MENSSEDTEVRIDQTGVFSSDDAEDGIPIDPSCEYGQLLPMLWREFSDVLTSRYGVDAFQFNERIITLVADEITTSSGSLEPWSGLISVQRSLNLHLEDFVSTVSHEMGHFYSYRVFLQLLEDAVSDEDGSFMDDVVMGELVTIRTGLTVLVNFLSEDCGMDIINEAVNELVTKEILSFAKLAIPGLEQLPSTADCYFELIEFLDVVIENLVLGWNNPEFRGEYQGDIQWRKNAEYRQLREEKLHETLVLLFPNAEVDIDELGKSSISLTKEMVFEILAQTSFGKLRYQVFAGLVETVFGAGAFKDFTVFSLGVDYEMHSTNEIPGAAEFLQMLVTVPTVLSQNYIERKSDAEKISYTFFGEQSTVSIDEVVPEQLQRTVFAGYEPYPLLDWAAQIRATTVEQVLQDHRVTWDVLLDPHHVMYQEMKEKFHLSIFTSDGVGAIHAFCDQSATRIELVRYHVMESILQNHLCIEEVPQYITELQLDKKTKIVITVFQLRERNDVAAVKLRQYENGVEVGNFVLFIDG